MPANPAARAPGGRPATTRSVSVMGPGDPLGDDLLRARQSRLNTAAFSAEHGAAYAAFAGITDRATAMMLHRHGVDWDDVNAYAATSVPISAYKAMCDLSVAGVRPADVTAWDKVAQRIDRAIYPHDMIAFAQVDLTVTQTEPYLAHLPTRQLPPYVTADLIKHQISVGRFDAYQRAGITTARNMVILASLGCRPKYVFDYKRHHGRVNEADYLRAYNCARVHSGRLHEITHEFVTAGTPEADIDGWAASTETPTRVTLFVRAGISHHEWVSDPTVRDATDHTIALLAAFRARLGDTPAEVHALATV